MTSPKDLDSVWEKRFERERKARRQAEQILEEKSLDLFQSNQSLRRMAAELDAMIKERTRALSFALEESESQKRELSRLNKDIQAQQDEVSQARQAAESANHMKSEFLANMSHEIRTPMNGVIGMVDLVLETDLSREQREYIGLIKTSAQHLLTVINDILDFSKIEAGKLDLQETEFDLIDLISETLKTLAPRVATKGLELACELGEDLPRFVRGDPSRLRQILLNLLGNSIKFTEHGHVGLKVRHSHQVTNDEPFLEFVAHDTGIGIPPEKQQTIFSAFSQADGNITHQYGGTGLGLTITRQLVEMMGGDIHVESEVGVGSSFHFKLRLRSSETPEDLRNLEAEFGSTRTLVVDANETSRQVLVLMLKHLGVKLLEQAANGQAAWNRMQEAQAAGTPFDLAVVDARLPGLDGFELAEKLRADPRLSACRLVLLTAYGVRGDAQRCKTLGLEAYLTKPVTLTELRETMQGTLGRNKGETGLITRHSLREARRKLHVLLAEDNMVNQKLAIKLLDKQGHSTHVAENGRLALDAWEQGAFDLILMDMMMPEMDGLETTRQIRQQEEASGRPRTPIIAMTANAMRGDEERCREAGMDGYVSKPIQQNLLFQEIDRVMARMTVSASDEEVLPDTPESADNLPIYDRADALLRIADDEELLNTLLDMFRNDAAGYLGNLEAALVQPDMGSLLRSAHTLKGVFATFSARRAEACVRDLEHKAQAGDIAACKALLPTLKSEIATFLEAIG